MIENNPNEIYAFLKATDGQLKLTGKLTIIQDEQIKLIKNWLFDEVQEQDKMNLTEDNLQFQEIKVLYESILSAIKGKSPVNYIGDYFISQHFTDEIGMDSTDETRQKEFGMNKHDTSNSSDNKARFDLIRRTFEKVSKSRSATDHLLVDETSQPNEGSQRSIRFSDLLELASVDFLRNKTILPEESIKAMEDLYVQDRSEENIGKVEDSHDAEVKSISLDKTVHVEKIENNSPNTGTDPMNPTSTNENKSKNLLHILKKERETPKLGLLLNKPNASTSGSRSSEKIDRELEQEISSEIFNYTKRMKNYANEFNKTLITDKAKLNKIEEIQHIDQSKTKQQMQTLTDFNRSLQIGFWKMLLLIIIVVVTFMMTMLTIRIFPKLA